MTLHDDLQPYLAMCASLTPDEEAACWAERTYANRWRLVRRHLPFLFCLLKRRPHLFHGLPLTEALDAGILGLFEATGTYDGRLAGFPTWAMFYVRAALGQMRRRNMAFPLLLGDCGHLPPRDPRPPPDPDLPTLLADLRAAVGRMGGRPGRVLKMHLAGMSGAEIGRAERISRQAVGQIISWAVRHLRFVLGVKEEM